MTMIGSAQTLLGMTAITAAFAGAVDGGFAAAFAQAEPQLSVYRGPGCVGRKRIPDFEAFLGRRVDRVVDALNQESWEKMRSSIPWVISCWRGSGLDLTLSVPMLTAAGPGTLRDGADGKYDDLFLITAKTLVANGYNNAVVRIGWEFNGEWMPWRADKDPDSYVRYFQRIVTLMRQAPGQAFRFEWTPNHGKHQIEAPLVYPGDDYVDVIGMDVYDQIWNPLESNHAWRWIYYRDQPFGLAWHRDFARRHGKLLSYPEWGIGQTPQGTGSGDNPYFIEQMANWIHDVKPLYHSYWDDKAPIYDAEISQGGRYPNSSAAFQRAFGPKAPPQ